MSDAFVPEPPVKQEHGPEQVCYSLSGTGSYEPFWRCICGWSAQEYCWEDLGRAFDEHLESVNDGS